jgi:hypothetical protein
MRKIIRFIFAILFTPIAISWKFLDWLYESDMDSIKNWRKNITFKSYEQDFRYNTKE